MQISRAEHFPFAQAAGAVTDLAQTSSSRILSDSTVQSRVISSPKYLLIVLEIVVVPAKAVSREAHRYAGKLHAGQALTLRAHSQGRRSLTGCRMIYISIPRPNAHLSR